MKKRNLNPMKEPWRPGSRIIINRTIQRLGIDAQQGIHARTLLEMVHRPLARLVDDLEVSFRGLAFEELALISLRDEVAERAEGADAELVRERLAQIPEQAALLCVGAK